MNQPCSGHAAVFLFCHQDDEFGVFKQLLVEQERGRQVVCAYLTSGVSGDAQADQRNRESLRALAYLGVSNLTVVFAGEQLGVADGNLMQCLSEAANWLKAWLSSLGSVEAIYVPAWEGGHPDHDALHALTTQLCHELGMTCRLRQFPLYRAYRTGGPLFKITSPMPQNGVVEQTPIAWRHRLLFLRCVLMYNSQRKTWLGLFPFLLAHYLFKGVQSLQPACASRVRERPHNGTLYYEWRGFTSWEEFHAHLERWLVERPPAKALQRLVDRAGQVS